MLISHERRFIFVKTRKTAGTSIEISLTSHLGPMDVVTPISAEDEAVRILAEQSARNFISVKAIEPGFKIADRETATLFAKQNAKFHAPRISFFNHMSAAQIRQAVGSTMWGAYRTLAVERIPFDRLISAYYFKISGPRFRDMGFSEFIRLDDPTLENSSLYRGTAGRIIVDKIIPYHELALRLSAELDLLGITLVAPLATAKSHYRTDRRHWSEVIAATDRDFISARFASEFDALDMTPDEAWLYGR